MPWGKFKGLCLDEIESSYLCWCLDNADQLRPALRAAIKAELGTRFGTTPPPPPSSSSSWRKSCPDPVLAAEIVVTGWRALVKKHHPDLGGDTRTMQLLNAAADWLKTQVPQ
jgi:hypothetical protein